jgi:hypothetical protein
VAQALKGCDCEEEEDVYVAAALPHAMAPVGAPSAHCCGGERSAYCCSGAEESKGGDGEEEKDGDAAAALPHTVEPVGAPSVYSCGATRLLCFRTRWRPWERQARQRRGFTASGEVTENLTASRSSVGSVKIR